MCFHHKKNAFACVVRTNQIFFIKNEESIWIGNRIGQHSTTICLPVGQPQRFTSTLQQRSMIAERRSAALSAAAAAAAAYKQTTDNRHAGYTLARNKHTSFAGGNWTDQNASMINCLETNGRRTITHTQRRDLSLQRLGRNVLGLWKKNYAVCK